MIDKRYLKGKYVTYMDKEGKFRTERVIRVTGSYVTVRTTIRVKTLWKFPKHRIHKDKIYGRQFKKKGIEEIKW